MGLKERLQGSDALQAAIVLERTTLEGREADLDCKKGELSSYRAEVAKLNDVIAQNVLTFQKKANIKATIDRLYKELETEKAAAETEIETLKVKYRGLQGELKKCDDILKDRDAILGAADKEREINEYLERTLPEMEKVAAEITSHQETIHALEKEIQTLVQQGKDLDGDAELAAIDKNISDAKAEITSHEQTLKALANDKDVATLENKIKNCKEKMTTLDLKDPACQSTTCSFIVGALEASKTLPDMEKELKDRTAMLADKKATTACQIDALNEGLSKVALSRKVRLNQIYTEKAQLSEEAVKKDSELVAETGAKSAKVKTLTALRQNVADKRLELAKVKELAAKKTDVELAGFRKKDIDGAMQDVIAQGKTLREAWAAKGVARKDAIDKEDSILIALDFEIDRAAEGKLKGLDGDIQSIEKVELPNIEKEILGIREKIAALQSDLSKMADATAELEKEQEEKDKLVREISEWSYLQSRCGKNGLQAMEIDGAAPLITSFANELLSQSFGRLYSVRLLTQDEEGREVLNIMVVGEDGEEDLLENKSGGEKVFCLMALRLAMTLLSKEKSNHAFLTAFSDESDGALDPENALNYVSMYRSFMQAGTFENFFFISHRPECRNLADHILTFKPGESPYWR